MSSSHNTCFGNQMVIICIGHLAAKEKFAIHEDALDSIAGEFHRILDSLSPQDTDSATIDRVYFLDEQPETFLAFLKWLYATYIGASLSALPSSTISLFQLYTFAYKYRINTLEDAIVSVLYNRFAIDNTLWLTLGSDKPALEALLKEVPSDAHLHRLVVRSLAYSMRSWDVAEDPWSEPGGSRRFSASPGEPATEHQVEEVMHTVPGELWAPISREILLAKTLGSWSLDFASTVEPEYMFLRKHECHGNDGLSWSWH